MTSLINALSEETTAQQLFDYITAFLLKQGDRSISGGRDAACLYRGPKKRMCAVGCILPDSLYSKCLEGIPVIRLLRDTGDSYFNDAETSNLFAQWREQASRFVSLLAALQNAHDAPCDHHLVDRREFWYTKFRLIADHHQLKFNPDLWKSL